MSDIQVPEEVIEDVRRRVIDDFKRPGQYVSTREVDAVAYGVEMGARYVAAWARQQALAEAQDAVIRALEGYDNMPSRQVRIRIHWVIDALLAETKETSA